jgi:hypothetical protein
MWYYINKLSELLTTIEPIINEEDYEKKKIIEAYFDFIHSVSI